ncbi:uncharacterized protein LOC119671753 [Teleopsis dalmanni]|uniref:uncharacterized protein LOC119671753 n=1 Tax=Teleopsis dalmanni TaxID=139649 RepID=UPI000D32B074|nr:uncharacterized protein LOC119671753 [Teleopsis dalmanni]XP_037938444.1 uncharacterized protein LOC119671753 [Teleopsis dalmanni]
MHRTMNKLGSYVKEDKEFENQDIKKKIKNNHRDRVLMARPLTVWERLSKVKKASSLEHVPEQRRGHALNRLGPPVSNSVPWQQESHEQEPRKTGVRPILPESRNIRRTTVQRTVILPPRSENENTGVSNNSNNSAKNSIKELLQARNISSSSSHTNSSENRADSSINVNVMTSIDIDCKSIQELQKKESNDSMEEYVIAPLIPVPTRTSLSNASRCVSNFCHIVEQQKRLTSNEDTELLKNVVKSDERYTKLRENDPALFKDILKSKLENIMRQELILKNALFSLDMNAHEIEHLEKAAVLENSTASKKPQVDVIFKNVPTLEKEIIILKALGEKLEATLRRTNAEGKNESENEIPFVTSLPNMESAHSCAWIEDIAKSVQIEAKVEGVKQDIGIAKEYRRADRTLGELKADADSKFWMFNGEEKNKMKCTSFNKLAQKPNVLLSCLKSDGLLTPFNLVDQDPMFLNSYFSKTLGENFFADEKLSDLSECSSEKASLLGESGDSTQDIQLKETSEVEPPKIEEIFETAKQKLVNKKTQTKDKNSVARSKVVRETKNTKKCVKRPKSTKTDSVPKLHGKRPKRVVTPMPLDKFLIEPKNDLIKTIVIGSVQVSVFLLFIMAFTYPDATC